MGANRIVLLNQCLGICGRQRCFVLVVQRNKLDGVAIDPAGIVDLFEGTTLRHFQYQTQVSVLPPVNGADCPITIVAANTAPTGAATLPANTIANFAISGASHRTWPLASEPIFAGASHLDSAQMIEYCISYSTDDNSWR